MSRAVVTTTIGCEGLDIEDGYHLLVADTPKSFAAGVTELFADPEKRAAMGRQGRHLVKRDTIGSPSPAPWIWWCATWSL